MKIRTRYSWFKTIIVLAIITFIVSLYDIFANDSEWFVYVMVIYIVLAIIALILYLGHKPKLEEPQGPPQEPAPPTLLPAEEVTPKPDLSMQGPHHFRCPFCANIFAMELTHLAKRHELRMDCPFCSNTIRIPARPKIAAGNPVEMQSITDAEQALFTCSNCGEFIRYSAPGQRPEDHARVYTCPHCGSDRVDPAVGAAA